MKKIATFCLLSMICLLVRGQDYLSRGKSYYANGNYSAAITQFDAQLAYLDSKNVNKNSDEYISVEKLLVKAKTCLPLLKKARTAFNDAEKAGTEDAYNAAIVAYDKLLKQNSTDRNAKAMKAKCLKAIDALAYELDASVSWALVNLDEISSIENFIRKYPDSRLVASAERQISEINDNNAWKKAFTKEDYQQYLVNFPSGLHREEAVKYIEHWEETALWREYASQNTVDAYKEYLEKYPAGLFTNEAKQGITDIKDDEAWATALKTNTLKGYKLYAIQFPRGRHKDAAHEKTNYLEEIRKKECDAVDMFRKSPSLNGLQAFENNYPNSEYRDSVYDSYAEFLCNRIDINSCKKADFREAMSYARTRTTKNMINTKEREWKSLRSAKRSKVVRQVIGGGLFGAAIVAGIIDGAKEASNRN